MAAAIWLVQVDDVEDPNKTVIDGIHSAVVNADDADTEADVIAEAVSAANAVGIPLPDDYFNSATLALTTLGTDEDATFYGTRRRVERIQ